MGFRIYMLNIELHWQLYIQKWESIKLIGVVKMGLAVGQWRPVRQIPLFQRSAHPKALIVPCCCPSLGRVSHHSKGFRKRLKEDEDAAKLHGNHQGGLTLPPYDYQTLHFAINCPSVRCKHQKYTLCNLREAWERNWASLTILRHQCYVVVETDRFGATKHCSNIGYPPSLPFDWWDCGKSDQMVPTLIPTRIPIRIVHFEIHERLLHFSPNRDKMIIMRICWCTILPISKLAKQKTHYCQDEAYLCVAMFLKIKSRERTNMP